jgi:hypothetical protein
LFADGLHVQGSVLLSDGFSSFGEIRLNGGTIGRNLDCSGATLINRAGYSLSAAGAHISGSAYFSETREWSTYPQKAPFSSIGTLRLEGAVIDGDLDFSAGSFLALAFLPRDAKPSDDELYAVRANGVKVGSDIVFDTFKASGIISLISANVGGDFQCRAAEFNFPGEEPLSADGIVVDGTTFLDHIWTNGILRFVQATLRQGFYVNGATFDTTGGCNSWTEDQSNTASIELGGPACGIYAPDAEIGGIFEWKRISKITNELAGRPNAFWLFVPRSKVTSIDDDQSSWVALDRLEVVDCQYIQIQKLSDADDAWRLQQLDRHYARENLTYRWPDVAINYIYACRSLARFFPQLQSFSRIKSLSAEARDTVKLFKPQPYIQLARTFHAAGFEAAAQRVYVRLERNMTRYSDIGFFRRFWRYMLDVTVRYGHQPFLPVAIILVWAVICSVLFQIGYDLNQILPSKDNQVSAAASYLPPHPRIPFNAFVYSVDTLVPIVDLNQKKNWTVSNSSSFPSGDLLFINTFFGWLMTTLFAAGVSGLLRIGQKT